MARLIESLMRCLLIETWACMAIPLFILGTHGELHQWENGHIQSLMIGEIFQLMSGQYHLTWGGHSQRRKWIVNGQVVWLTHFILKMNWNGKSAGIPPQSFATEDALVCHSLFWLDKSLGCGTDGSAGGGSGGFGSDWAGMADHDCLTLHLSESWLDERMQTKLVEPTQSWNCGWIWHQTQMQNYARVKMNWLGLMKASGHELLFFVMNCTGWVKDCWEATNSEVDSVFQTDSEGNFLCMGMQILGATWHLLLLLSFHHS